MYVPLTFSLLLLFSILFLFDVCINSTIMCLPFCLVKALNNNCIIFVMLKIHKKTRTIFLWRS